MDGMATVSYTHLDVYKRQHLGRATDRFMSYGCYDEPAGRLFPAGLWDEQLLPLDAAAISEDISHAWYVAADLPQHPSGGGTVPVADKTGAYSWCKACLLYTSRCV